jgi:hypothetical protein
MVAKDEQVVYFFSEAVIIYGSMFQLRFEVSS